MSGNATEEGLIGQIGNPSHSDPLRVVALAAFVGGGIAYPLARWVEPRLTIWGGIVIGFSVCILVALVLSYWVRRQKAARDMAELEQRRAAQMAETEAQLALMKEGAQA